MSEAEAVKARRAIEALRAGVPNRAAIRAAMEYLGAEERARNQNFLGRLRGCAQALGDGGVVEGVLLAGGFGAGKSHQLGYFRELALQENFVASPVPVSKETPLFDPARVFAAAVETAVVPHTNDDVMTTVMHALRPGSSEYEALQAWAAGEVAQQRLSPLFSALLHVVPRRRSDPDARARIARFFGGGKLNIGVVKTWLREAGAGKLFDIKPLRDADLAAQRLLFVPRLLRAAGYAGWCILLDEIELIGRYSPLQRGRSYAELARWLGGAGQPALPGILVVAAVTDDFADEMFDRRCDDKLVPPRLEQKGLTPQARLAQLGIELLKRPAFRLSAPDEAGLQRTLELTRGLYRLAYDWTPPELGIGEWRAGRSMRQYVKSWITTFDIERLYSEAPRIELGTIAPDYTESSEIEQAPLAADAEDTDG